ncbi:MAG: glycosyltransferase family 39 protein [bacterium]
MKTKQVLRPTPTEPLKDSCSLWTRIFKPFAAVLGLSFLVLAALTNYTSNYLLANRWVINGKSTVFFRLPGMPPDEFFYFPLSWQLLGLFGILLLFGFTFRSFRTALYHPFRSKKTALPFIFTLVFLIFTLYPWDFITAKQNETGAQLMFYLSLSTAGFIFLLSAFYSPLAHFEKPLKTVLNWLFNIKPRLFLILTAGFLFLVSNLVSYFVFEHLPHIQDSISQLFQARIFAQGKIHLPSPQFPDFFDYTHIINNGNWYSQYPWLHSFLLMLFVFLGIPWLLNPLLGALFILVLYHLGKELYDETTARIAVLLASFSPFIFNMSAEYMNHPSALLFATLFILFYFRTVHNKRPLQNALLAGISLGAVANIRPYTALAIAIPFAFYALMLILRHPRRLLIRFLSLALAAGAVTSLLFLYNYLTNGHPLIFGYVVKWGPGHEIGFGHSGWGPPHTPYQGLLNLGNNFNLINKFLFESPWPALVLLLIPFAAGTRNRYDILLFAGFLALPLAYFFYWFHNVCFGPRFLYESSACLFLLGARGVKEIPRLLKNTFGLNPVPSHTQFLFRAALLSILFTTTIALPPLFKLYHTYGGVSALVHKTVQKARLNNALIFCDHFGNGFSYNRLDLQGPVVYAKDYGYLNAALTLAYPNRQYYFAKGDTILPLTDIQFENSLLKQTLDDFSTTLTDTTICHRYKTVLWPFADIQPLPETSQLNIEVIDYRTISREIFSQRHTIDDYTPILAFWLFDDPREHLALFSTMDEAEHTIAAGLKFTLRRFTRNNLGAVYDIRR